MVSGYGREMPGNSLTSVMESTDLHGNRVDVGKQGINPQVRFVDPKGVSLHKLLLRARVPIHSDVFRTPFGPTFQPSALPCA